MWKYLERRLPRAKRLYIFRYLAYQFLCEHWHTYVSVNCDRSVRLNMGRGSWNSHFCADCFPFIHNGEMYVFYETVNNNGKGMIGCFKYEGEEWRQLGIVLENPWHMSYPQVFEEDGHIYMIPEESDLGRGSVNLYEATDFPYKWEKRAKLVDRPFADSTILKHKGHWYMACYTIPPKESAELWHAPSLFGPWARHPMWDKINQSRRLRRCGGRFIEEGDMLYRVAQDCNGGYGKRLFKVKVNIVTPYEYEEGNVQRINLPIKLDSKHCAHTFNITSSHGRCLSCYDTKHFALKPFKKILMFALAFVWRKLK